MKSVRERNQTRSGDETMTTRNKEAELRIGKDLHCYVSNFAEFSDGFSFTVVNELDAYKAAYKYQGVKKTVVKYAPNINMWLIQVYSK
jgi:hypothetical protein